MNKTEEKTKEYFEASGISLVRIAETTGKTPDFEAQKFLVEVKEIQPEEKEGLHPDSTYNAVKNNLKDAANQFYSYDPQYKKKHIVVVFSEEIIKENIYSIWTGELSPARREGIFKGGMVLSRDHRRYIDAVVWFRRITDSKPKHIWLADENTKRFFFGVIT